MSSHFLKLSYYQARPVSKPSFLLTNISFILYKQVTVLFLDNKKMQNDNKNGNNLNHIPPSSPFLSSRIATIFEDIGAYFLLIANVTWVTFRRPPHFALIRDQMYEVGVLSVPVVAITGFSRGWCLLHKRTSSFPTKDWPVLQALW